MNGNFKGYTDFDKEEKRMDIIRTGRYKNYGQLEDQAEGIADVEAFVFRNGEVVPANQTENSTSPVIKTANEPNFGQLEDQASGMADVEAFVFRNGEVVPASQAENSNTPVINTAPEKNYGQLEEVYIYSRYGDEANKEIFVYRDDEPVSKVIFFDNHTETDK